MTYKTPVLWTLMAATAAGLALQAAPALADPPNHARAWGYRDHGRHDGDRGRHYYDGRYDDRDDGRDDRDDRRGDRDDRYDDRDNRYGNYDRYGWRPRPMPYAGRPVYVVSRLPSGYRPITYRGDRYYCDRGGRWYQPYGSMYMMVAPPAGVIIDSRGIAIVANLPIVRW